MKKTENKYVKKHPFLTKILRMAKYYFLMFVRKEDSPSKIAHGFAIGIFVGFLPIIPFQALFSLLLCSIFKVNKLAGVLGSTTITNAVMAIPVFYAQHFLGRIFILHDFSYDRFKLLFTQLNVSNIHYAGKDILIMFEMVTIGGIIVGIIFYPLAYYVVFRYITKRRERIRLLKKLKKIRASS
ncbi:MAG TPA: DUF2062 domain-containing protein [Clostridiales bacterium]|nr:DUF2062 domain-containing protein [Clostridiales bacterium]HQP69418.1 DUF2062 domain-containing protein [Clostridiales bacterium]